MTGRGQSFLPQNSAGIILGRKEVRHMADNHPGDDTDILVTLDLDDGTQAECEILTIFSLDDQDYIVLLPQNEAGEPNEEGEVYIYRYFEDGEGNPSLENILDDEEYERVADRFDEWLDESEFDDMEE